MVDEVENFLSTVGLGEFVNHLDVENEENEEIIPLAVAQIPPFPREAIPKVLLDLGDTAHKAHGIPAEYVWCAGLPVLAAAIGRSHKLFLDHSWSTYPIVWVGISGQSGTGKTPAIKLVSEPLEEIDTKRHVEYEKEWRLYEKAKATDKHATPPAPRHRLVVDDATIEALLRILAKTPRGLLLRSDELVRLILGLGQYKQGRGSDRQTILSLWSGGNMRVDRVGKGEDRTIFVKEPICPVLGGIQPSEVPKLLAGEDGMAQRWLIGHFPHAQQNYPSGAIMDQMSLQIWRQLVFRLVEEDEEKKIFLGDESRKAWNEIRWQCVDKARAALSPQVANFWSKMPAHIASLALTLHVAEAAEAAATVGLDVSTDTLFHAQAIGNWFASQFEFYAPKRSNLMVKPFNRDVDEAVELIMAEAQRLGKPLTMRDIQKRHVGGIRTMQEAKEAAQRCEETYPGCLVRQGRGQAVMAADAKLRSLTTSV